MENSQHNQTGTSEEFFDSDLTGSFSDNSYQNLQRRNNRRRLILRITFGAFFLIALIIIAIAASFIFFRIENIEIYGNEFYLPEEILDFADIQEGSSLLLVDRNEIVENILREMPHIHRVNVELSLPSTLRITVVEDSPILYFHMAEHYIVLSRELRVLAVFNAENVDRNLLDRLYSTFLPEVLYANYGQVIRFSSDTNSGFIVDLIDSIEYSPLSGRVNNIDLSNRFDIRIRYDDRWDIFLGNRHDFNYKLLFVHEALQYFVPYATGRMYFEDTGVGFASPNSTQYFIAP
ncbi:MAG: FtsQ-type POTRA domain-containing protein [Oscillospiraceae bacterium]|nr:FtsQ-type POTRA domain-containing protein [Oscillospiraceae bacterium]